MAKPAESVLTAMSSLRDRVGAADKGATMTEYGLLITLIALVVFGALFLLGPVVKSLYTSVLPYL